jgi:hypothetical protein
VDSTFGDPHRRHLHLPPRVGYRDGRRRQHETVRRLRTGPCAPDVLSSCNAVYRPRPPVHQTLGVVQAAQVT